MRQSLAALTVNCLPTLDLADRRAEAAAREANMLMLTVTYWRIKAKDQARIKIRAVSRHRGVGWTDGPKTLPELYFLSKNSSNFKIEQFNQGRFQRPTDIGNTATQGRIKTRRGESKF